MYSKTDLIKNYLNNKYIPDFMKSVLLFARLYFDTKITHFTEVESKKERECQLLLDVISPDSNINSLLKKMGKTSLIIHNETWKFGGIQHGENYIFGRLGKIKGHIYNFFDEKNKDFIKSEFHEANLCNFLIDLDNHIIVYESRRNIGEKAPILVIQDTFNSFFDNAEKIHINLITDNRKIIDRIRELNSIIEIKMKLNPTNPDSTPSSDKMDQFLKELNADKIKIEASSSKGIDLEGGGGLIQSGLRLAEEGYGYVQVKGIMITPHKQQKIELINLFNLPMKEREDLSESDKIAINQLKKKIKSVIELLNVE
ncbi:MAG: DUF4747 family protein [Bacteroidales bacterium]